MEGDYNDTIQRKSLVETTEFNFDIDVEYGYINNNSKFKRIINDQRYKDCYWTLFNSNGVVYKFEFYEDSNTFDVLHGDVSLNEFSDFYILVDLFPILINLAFILLEQKNKQLINFNVYKHNSRLFNDWILVNKSFQTFIDSKNMKIVDTTICR
jgi:hypothetical protein